MSEFVDIAMGLLIIEMMAILFQVLGVIVLACVVGIGKWLHSQCS